jgi:hypothetical protein
MVIRLLLTTQNLIHLHFNLDGAAFAWKSRVI